MYDIIVIGAGPTGSYIAYRLAEMGHSVAVFEEHERIGEPMQCSGIIGAECIKRFPIFEGTVLREVRSAKLISPSGIELRLEREDVQAYIIDRTAFDRSLADKAGEIGARYHIPSRVKDIIVRDDHVSIETEDIEAHMARAVVIASGFYSKLPQRLGMDRAGDFIVGAQAEVETTTEDNELEVYFDQELAPGFFGWFVPAAPGRALVGLLARREPQRHLRAFLETLHNNKRVTSSHVKITPGGIPLKPLRRTYGRRVVVVGDAAGQVKPITGGGVYYGLLCAEIAADTLHHALTVDDFSAKMLSRYQQGWRKAIGRELRIGYFARRAYGRLSNRRIDSLFRFVQSRGIHQSLLNSPELSFDWHSKALIKGIKLIGPWRCIWERGGKK